MIAVFLSGCPIVEPEPVFYKQYTPVMMKRKRTEMEKAIRLEAAHDINDPAKIFVKDQYIFISEKYQGIHIIDNTNPRIPLNQGFIRIPGCVDIAIKGTTLYADNATDLLAIEMADPKNILGYSLSSIGAETGHLWAGLMAIWMLFAI